MTEEKTPIISNDLLDILVCPITGANLEYIAEKNVFMNNQNTQLKYKILDGIPDFTFSK